MLKYVLLAILGICLTHAQQHLTVSITYNDPQLVLRLPDTDSDVTSVTFHYRVAGGENHSGRGTRTANGWQYHGSLVTNGRETIHASAEIQYSSGLHITTPEATHVVGKRGLLTLVQPVLRRLRAVTFKDDFNAFNEKDWWREVSMFGGRNWEFQVYTNEAKNVFARDGKLFLYPTLTVDDPRFDENFLKTGVMDIPELFGYCTNTADYGCNRDGHNGMLPPIMSGKVSSVPTIKFGTLEVRAKIPKGDWLWPAIWMMPKKSVYGGWPRSGEIDIMESRGNAGDLGVGTVSSTLHWGPAWNINKWDLTHGEKKATGGSWHDDFHTWKLEWTADHIKTFVDNQEILTVDPGAGFWQKGGFTGDNVWAGGSKIAPFDQDFYLILNVAVGGTNGYFSDTANWGVRKPWPNSSPHANEDFWNARNDWLPTWQGDNVALQVDWVEFRN